MVKIFAKIFASQWSRVNRATRDGYTEKRSAGAVPVDRPQTGFSRERRNSRSGGPRNVPRSRSVLPRVNCPFGPGPIRGPRRRATTENDDRAAAGRSVNGPGRDQAWASAEFS